MFEILINTIISFICFASLCSVPAQVLPCIERILEACIFLLFLTWNIDQWVNNKNDTRRILFNECREDALCVLNNIVSILQVWLVIWIWIPRSRLFKNFHIGVILGAFFQYALYLFFIQQPEPLVAPSMLLPIVYAWLLGTIWLCRHRRMQYAEHVQIQSQNEPCWRLGEDNLRNLFFSWPLFTTGLVLQSLSLVVYPEDSYRRLGNNCLCLAVFVSLQMKTYFSLEALGERTMSRKQQQPPLYDHLSFLDVDELELESETEFKDLITYSKWINPQGFFTLKDFEIYEKSDTLVIEWLLYLEECKVDRSTVATNPDQQKQLESFPEFPFQPLKQQLQNLMECTGSEEEKNRWLDRVTDETHYLPEFAIEHLDRESQNFSMARFSNCFLSDNITFGKVLKILRQELDHLENQPEQEKQEDYETRFESVQEAFQFFTRSMLPIMITCGFKGIRSMFPKEMPKHWALIVQLNVKNIHSIVMG